MFNSFRRLQWKLTLSYAVITVGTGIVLTLLLIAIAIYKVSNGFLWVVPDPTWTVMYTILMLCAPEAE